MDSRQRFYSEDEAQEILRLATHHNGGNMSRDDLIRAAEELGISPDAIRQAEAQFQHQKLIKAEEERQQELRREFAKYMTRKLVGEVIGCLKATAICVVIWWFTGHGYFWPQWVMLGTGIGVISAFMKAYANPASKEAAYERWLRKKKNNPVPLPPVLPLQSAAAPAQSLGFTEQHEQQRTGL